MRRDCDDGKAATTTESERTREGEKAGESEREGEREREREREAKPDFYETDFYGLLCDGILFLLFSDGVRSDPRSLSTRGRRAGRIERRLLRRGAVERRIKTRRQFSEKTRVHERAGSQLRFAQIRRRRAITTARAPLLQPLCAILSLTLALLPIRLMRSPRPNC